MRHSLSTGMEAHATDARALALPRARLNACHRVLSHPPDPPCADETPGGLAPQRNLELRFMENTIYTYVGTVLISINPFKELPMYSADTLERCASR